MSERKKKYLIALVFCVFWLAWQFYSGIEYLHIAKKIELVVFPAIAAVCCIVCLIFPERKRDGDEKEKQDSPMPDKQKKYLTLLVVCLIMVVMLAVGAGSWYSSKWVRLIALPIATGLYSLFKIISPKK